MARLHLCMDPRDNVTTLLDDATDQRVLSDGRPAAAGVPFGHKVALVAIAAGAAVVKYGVVIGHSTEAIQAGEHVHVHNCH